MPPLPEWPCLDRGGLSALGTGHAGYSTLQKPEPLLRLDQSLAQAQRQSDAGVSESCTRRPETIRQFGRTLCPASDRRRTRTSSNFAPSTTLTTDMPIDAFEKSGIQSAEDIRNIFVQKFYFGCEGDDPLNAIAFNPRGILFDARLKPLYDPTSGMGT